MEKTSKPRRGRKPLPPEEKAKRGRKKRAEALLAERRQQDAPTLHISFVCRDDTQETPTPTPASTSAIGVQSIALRNTNPMSDVMRPRITPEVRNETMPTTSKSLILCESESDEDINVRKKPRVDVSQVTSERVISLLGAHTTKDTWPSSTSVCCWNCTEPFDGIPLAIPGGLEKHTKRLKDCTGVFCSFNCMRRWILNSNRHTSWEQMQLITYMHKVIVGHTVSIPPAASPHVLKKFGGYMDIDEYRKDFVCLPPTDEMYDTNQRRDRVEILQKKCIPSFQTAFHTHNKHHITDSMTFDREHGKSGYDRTRPLSGSQVLVNSMNMKVS